MSADVFVDPVEALAAAEAFEAERDPVEALALVGGLALPFAAIVMTAPSAETVRALEQARGIALPSLGAFTFTQSDLDTIKEGATHAVTDKTSQERGWRLIKVLKAGRKACTDFYGDMRKPYRQVADAIVDLEQQDLPRFAEVEQQLGARIEAYDRAEEARERIERERLQAIADREAREEQERLAESMRRVASAEKHPSTAAAMTREAEAIAQAPVAAATVHVESNRARVKGVGLGAWQYSGELLDKKAFIDKVAAGEIPLDAVDVRQAWINQTATDLKDALQAKYPFLRLHKKRGTRG